jgi:hypothetical protein
MATFNKFQAFVEHVNEGVHNFASDATCTPTVFMTTEANAPSNSLDAVLADVTQISYTNIATSRVITVASSSQTTGTYSLVLTDLVLTASGAVATFRRVGIYNDDPTSPADPLICHYDYGSDVTLANLETFTLDFGANLYTMV